MSELPAHLTQLFKETFGRTAAFVVRAPGRVNLLGEHTDYNALPVLPMAIERCVRIAAAPRHDRLIVLHNAGAFQPRRYELERTIPPFTAGDWGNYTKAAAQGLTDYYDAPLAEGADLLVEGDIPTGAGLSSSSALVVASALCLLAVNERTISYETLAEILPRAERYVGTLSGGMDQTISLLAQAGHALRIDFSPLRYRPVPLPADYSIVVCNSLVQAEKSGAAKEAYNTRVRECRLACRVLAKVLDRPLSSLGALSRAFPQRPLTSFIEDLAGVLPDAPLGLDRVAAIIGVSIENIRRECDITASDARPFAVLRRARHVLSEAERVDDAERALLANDAVGFGRLMDASHASCRDDYEISCSDLDELVRLAKEAGALGARLTGAGFGGCTVNLVATDQVDGFLQQVDERFYVGRSKSSAAPTGACFVFTPCRGAETLRVATGAAV
jgi:galactokinase